MARLSGVRAAIRTRRLAADAALASVLLGAALLSSHVTLDYLAVDPAFERPDETAIAAGLVVMTLPLALRRRWPLSVLLACTAGFLLSRIAFDGQESPVTSIVVSLALYSAAAHGRPRRRAVVCGLCVAAMMAELWREAELYIPADVPNRPLVQIIVVMLLSFALLCALWALGAAIGSGRRRARELLERTAQLEHEREERARRAVFDERVRIARELHDVVAHHVSTIGVQAGAARMVLQRDPVKAKEALTAIETASRDAVAELHRLLGFLRRADEPDELDAQPGVGRLPDLASTMSDADLSVEVRVEGEQRALPASVDVSAYRIVQEALTNTLKHAGASRADVRLRYLPDALELEIVDDGRGNGAPAPASGGGLGLIGMRERANLHGGRLTTGSRPGGGFAVRVTLPTTGSAP